MKKISEPLKTVAVNGWGATSEVTRQRFEVTSEDIGKVRGNYLGFNHRHYAFVSADLGRVIEVLTYPGEAYTSWSFVGAP